MNPKLVIAILAAGKGKRMKSSLPKVLHTINNKTLIENVLETSFELNSNKVIVIVGYKKEMIKNKLSGYNIEFAEQNEQKGTGHAIMQCKKNIENIDGDLLILSGDVPMISQNTLSNLIKIHRENNSKASLITADIKNPFGYGRIKRDLENHFISIVEHKDANSNELKINEINAGIYIFDISTLFSKLSKIKNNNSQGEYYLGDVLKHIDSNRISIYKTANSSEILGINNTEQLNEVIEKNIN
tara:strand:- start:60 stop:788 length:729 start_codon:yes stop_codon:yes gene_type:complete